jgi:uncharacterized protein YybS (DUF2232 family)
LSSSQQSAPLKHAVLWGIVFWFIHMSMLTPLLVLTIWFASVPGAVLYTRTDRKVFAAVVATAIVAGSLAAGSAALHWLMIVLHFLIPSIVIGEAFRRRMPAKKVITYGVVAFLAMFLGAILVGTMLGFDLNRAVSSLIREGMQTLPEPFHELVTEESLAALIQLTTMMVPFYLFTSSLMLTMITYAISRRILVRTGADLQGLPKIREWRMPRAFVWYYLITLFLDLLIPKDDGSFFATIIVNLVPLFMFAFAVQGIAFLFFIAYEKKKAWIPWLGILVFIFVPPLFSAFSLLGVFDTAFPIRDRIRKS